MAWGSVQMAIFILAALDYLECGMPLSRRRGSNRSGCHRVTQLTRGTPADRRLAGCDCPVARRRRRGQPPRNRCVHSCQKRSEAPIEVGDLGP